MKFLILFLMTQSLFASTSYKDENFSLKKTVRDDKTIISFEGLIRSPLAREFKNLLIKTDLEKPLELRLNSVGGSIYETQAVIAVIKELKEKQVLVATRVDQGSLCASSCVPIFAQGIQRLAGTASSFMFHGVAPLAVTNIPSEKETDIMIETYRGAGINEDWIQKHIGMKVWSTPSETWYNGKELFESGSNFVTSLLNNRIFFEPYNRDFGPKPR